MKAFKNFDWETFKNCFSKDATVFFPGEYGKRKTGQLEIEGAWKEVFPEFIDSSKSFDLQLNPQNMLIQIYGSSALVIFKMVAETDYLSRRTLVL